MLCGVGTIKLQFENLFLGAFISGLIVSVTILLAYGLPSLTAEQTLFQIMTRFGAVNPEEIQVALNNRNAGYLLFKDFWGWLLLATVAGVTVALFLTASGLFMKAKNVRPQMGVILMGVIGGLLSSTSLISFFSSWNFIYVFTWLSMIFGFGFSAYVFRHYADPKVPDPYENTPVHKKLELTETPEWAIAATKRIAEKD